ncbi:hypothetical protein, partial [Hoeflea sp.]|uniref:hypothetical protein n=1 Tax=Hoeflea sp. TaxID=1940281 RepID=UPI002AFFABBC
MTEVENEYLGLPDDPEEAFAVLQRQKWQSLQATLKENEFNDWTHERRYVDHLIAFDEVHDLGLFTGFKNAPYKNNDFADFYMDFCRHAEVSAQKIMMEAARRQKI